MATFKVDNFFSTNTGPAAGWVETWYLVAADINAALGAATATAPVGGRLGVLHPQYSWPLTRVSDVLVLRDSKISEFPANASKGTFPEPPQARDLPETSEEPWDGLLIRTEAGSTQRRSFIMRGLPTDVITTTYAYDPSAEWLQQWGIFRTAWLAAGFMLRTRSVQFPPPIGIVNPIAPTAVEVGEDQKSLSITFAAPLSPSLLPGGFFILKNVTEAWPVNHLWRVFDVQGSTILTFPQRRRIFGTPILGQARVQPIFFAYTPITDMIARRGARKATGRPFGELVGKQRTQPT